MNHLTGARESGRHVPDFILPIQEKKKKGKMKQRTASPLLMHLLPSTPTHELCYGSKLCVSNVWTTG